jgi:hypothetical protein
LPLVLPAKPAGSGNGGNIGADAHGDDDDIVITVPTSPKAKQHL